ncbi:MAG TPA: nucleotidyltransferase domain-containing protein [Desulfuromonadales bacterium]|nr:nucleotidyltransferase domain-containing protein [Desulfuromonadales bacterium]
MQNQPVTEELLKEMTAKIVREVNPRKIILFGSHARGTAHADSDLDFLIVEDGPFNAQHSRRGEMARLWMLFPDVRVPIDFLVYSAEEVSKLATSKNHVIHHAMSDGRVLYEC